jgi:hypothetical protein
MASHTSLCRFQVLPLTVTGTVWAHTPKPQARLPLSTAVTGGGKRCFWAPQHHTVHLAPSLPSQPYARLPQLAAAAGNSRHCCSLTVCLWKWLLLGTTPPPCSSCTLTPQPYAPLCCSQPPLLFSSGLLVATTTSGHHTATLLVLHPHSPTIRPAVLLTAVTAIPLQNAGGNGCFWAPHHLSVRRAPSLPSQPYAQLPQPPAAAANSHHRRSPTLCLWNWLLLGTTPPFCSSRALTSKQPYARLLLPTAASFAPLQSARLLG